MNPASVVRGPKLVVSEGKTPVLESAEVAQLLETGCAKIGGKRKQIAVHTCWRAYLHAYLAAAGLGESQT